MKSIVGQTVGLRAAERADLERLLAKRLRGGEVIPADFAKRMAERAHALGRQLALLVDRGGEILHLIVGTRDRVYLPDLGRYRLDISRLRRVRLIVFAPTPEERLERHPAEPLPYGFEDGTGARRAREEQVFAPPVAHDLLTDLEKLRLDALLVIGVDSDGEVSGVAFGFLQPGHSALGMKHANGNIGFRYRSDLGQLRFDFREFVEVLEELLSERVGKSRERSGTRAVLVGVYTGHASAAEASMAELCELARTAGVEVADTVVQRRTQLDPRTVIGKGKLEDLVLHCLDLGAELLIFDRELLPAQLRSITNSTELKVLDRSMLILDIFAQRAKSSEGRVQVELAQLRYSLPRLTERDTGLSRLSGGIGGRGPGETKLEISRRRARDRIADLEKRIEKLADQRGLRRERRQARGVPVVAIVGYTNAGKSTLLNALTKGDVLVENKLFATLDPSSRRMRFPNEREVIFVDTVGFIRELPQELVAAFRATLEEVAEADVLLHVVDAANRDALQQVDVVRATLAGLGYGEMPELVVWNKTDQLSAIELKGLLNTRPGIAISALNRTGLAELIAELQNLLRESFSGRDPGGFTEISSNVRD